MLRNINRRVPFMVPASSPLRSLPRIQRPSCPRCDFAPQTAGFSSTVRRWDLRTTRSIKYNEKVMEHKRLWEEKAARILRGEETALFDKLETRGYIKDVAGQSRDNVRELMRQKRIGAYVGIDPTAPSLHVGHLLPLMVVFWMYMHGHRATTLIGGATAKIGDPTGRLKDRESENDDFAKNMASLHYQLQRIWTNVEAQARRYGYEKDWAWRRDIVNNNRWWNKKPLFEFLHRLGRHVRLGPMLSRETVKRKYTEGDGLSFAELTYTLMQGWDWWELYKQMDIQMQIGGSDQYGNIVTGTDTVKIVRRSEQKAQPGKFPSGFLYDPVGFTVPLLTSSAGEKIGKSSGGGNLWLDSFKTSAYDLYGYFVRQPDEDVKRLLNLLTFVPEEEINRLMQVHEEDRRARIPQHKLAFEVLALVHGMDVARHTEREHKSLHGRDPNPVVFQHDPEKQVTPNNAAASINMQLPKSLIEKGNIARILYAARLASSVTEGNRLACQKAVYIGGRPGRAQGAMNSSQIDFKPVALWFPEETKQFIIDEKLLILRKGKHNVRIIELVSDEEWKLSGQQYPGEPGTGKMRALRQEIKALAEMKTSLAAEGGEEKVKETLEGFDERLLSLAEKVEEVKKELKWALEVYEPGYHNRKSDPKYLQNRLWRLEKEYSKMEMGRDLLKAKLAEGASSPKK